MKKKNVALKKLQFKKNVISEVGIHKITGGLPNTVSCATTCLIIGTSIAHETVYLSREDRNCYNDILKASATCQSVIDYRTCGER